MKIHSKKLLYETMRAYGCTHKEQFIRQSTMLVYLKRLSHSQGYR